MENIDQIENKLRKGELILDPHGCAQFVAQLSGELSFYLSKQGDIAQQRSKNWLEIRKTCKSDTQAEKEWSITKEGIEYAWYEVRIKRCKSLITGLKVLIKNAELEQMNLH